MKWRSDPGVLWLTCKSLTHSCLRTFGNLPVYRQWHFTSSTAGLPWGCDSGARWAARMVQRIVQVDGSSTSMARHAPVQHQSRVQPRSAWKTFCIARLQEVSWWVARLINNVVRGWHWAWSCTSVREWHEKLSKLLENTIVFTVNEQTKPQNLLSHNRKKAATTSQQEKQIPNKGGIKTGSHLCSLQNTLEHSRTLQNTLEGYLLLLKQRG